MSIDACTSACVSASILSCASCMAKVRSPSLDDDRCLVMWIVGVETCGNGCCGGLADLTQDTGTCARGIVVSGGDSLCSAGGLLAVCAGARLDSVRPERLGPADGAAERARRLASNKGHRVGQLHWHMPLVRQRPVLGRDGRGMGPAVIRTVWKRTARVGPALRIRRSGPLCRKGDWCPLCSWKGRWPAGLADSTAGG